METTEKTKQENKVILRKYWEYFEKGELNKIENELWAKNYTLHFPNKTEPLNIKESLELLREYNRAFPDLKFNIEEQITEGDFVVDRFTARGTHKGEFHGISPTNKNVRFTGIAINRVVDNKIVERWTELDSLGMMAQLGVVLEPAHQV